MTSEQTDQTAQTPAVLAGPPPAGDEIDTLVGGLERNRRTFAWKCSGLDPEAMRRTVGASRLTALVSSTSSTSPVRSIRWGMPSTLAVTTVPFRSASR